MAEPTEITGTAALRARVLSRLKRAHLGRTAEDLSISLQALESFAHGGDLPEADIHKLVGEFYMNAKWDPAIDRLIDTMPPPPKAGIIPEPFRCADETVEAARKAYYAAIAATLPPQPVRTAPQPGPATSGHFPKRPGFAS